MSRTVIRKSMRLENYQSPVDHTQVAMQFFVDGMSNSTDMDALLYSKATGAGLAQDYKGVAVNNIVGVNIDKTDLKNQSDFITTIAEETRHNTSPDDHNANQYAAQAAYVWREENIKEGRITGQGISTEQWRNDNRNDATILKNNERIGSQRVADMEFRGLNDRIELPLIRDTSAAFAKQQGITPEEAEQQLVEQALKRVDSEFAHLPENAAADEWLNAMDNGIIKDENGEYTVKMFDATEEQKNNHTLFGDATAVYNEVHNPNHVLVADLYNSQFVFNAEDPLKSAEALSRVIIGQNAFENNTYGQNDVVFGMDYGIFNNEFIVVTPVAYGKPRTFKNGVFDPIDLNDLVNNGYISGDTETLADRLGFMGYSQWELANNDNQKQAVFLESVRYLSNDSSTPVLVMSDFEENFNNRFGSTKHVLGNYFTAEEQGKIQAGLNGMQPGDMLNLSAYLGTSANRAIANNENFVTGFKEHVVNEANKTTFLDDPSANVSSLTVSYVEQFGRSFETTFDSDSPAFLQVNAAGDAFWNTIDVATIFVPGRLAGNGKAGTTEKLEHTNDGVEIVGGYGTDIQMDGHKIYSSNYAPLSQNDKATYRLSDPGHRETAKDVYFGENVITSYYEVRKNLENKSLYVGEINIDNILDLTNSDITDIMGIDYSRFTTVANDFDRIQKAEVYKYTNLVGNQAFDAGYNGVLFNSSRNLSENNQVILLFEGRYKPDNIKKIIDERINREKKSDQDKKD